MLYTPHIHNVDSSIYTEDQLKDYSKLYYRGQKNFDNSPAKENPRHPHGDPENYKLENMIKKHVEDNNKSILEVLASRIFHSKLFMLDYIEIPMIVYFIITVIINTVHTISQAYTSFQNNGCSSKTLLTLIIKLILVGLPIQHKKETQNLSFMERNLLIREIKEQVIQEIANYKTTQF